MKGEALRRHYEELAARYDRDRVKAYFDNNLRHLAEILRGVEGRVLEIGCGTGAYLAALRARGHDVVGIDYAQEMCAAARARLTAQGELAEELVRRADAEEGLEFPGPFAAVLSVDSWEFFARPRQVVENVHAALVPGGCFAILTPNPWASPLINLLEWTGVKKLKPAFAHYHSFFGRTRRLTARRFRLTSFRRTYYGLEYVYVFTALPAVPGPACAPTG